MTKDYKIKRHNADQHLANNPHHGQKGKCLPRFVHQIDVVAMIPADTVNPDCVYGGSQHLGAGILRGSLSVHRPAEDSPEDSPEKGTESPRDLSDSILFFSQLFVKIQRWHRLHCGPSLQPFFRKYLHGSPQHKGWPVEPTEGHQD